MRRARRSHRLKPAKIQWCLQRISGVAEPICFRAPTSTLALADPRRSRVAESPLRREKPQPPSPWLDVPQVPDPSRWCSPQPPTPSRSLDRGVQEDLPSPPLFESPRRLPKYSPQTAARIRDVLVQEDLTLPPLTTDMIRPLPVRLTRRIRDLFGEEAD